MAAGRLPGASIDRARFDYLRHGWRTTNRLLRTIVQRPASAATRRALQDAARAGADQSTLVALALSSPGFQQQ
jgi:hypothetical protein